MFHRMFCKWKKKLGNLPKKKEFLIDLLNGGNSEIAFLMGWMM